MTSYFYRFKVIVVDIDLSAFWHADFESYYFGLGSLFLQHSRWAFVSQGQLALTQDW